MNTPISDSIKEILRDEEGKNQLRAFLTSRSKSATIVLSTGKKVDIERKTYNELIHKQD